MDVEELINDQVADFIEVSSRQNKPIKSIPQSNFNDYRELIKQMEVTGLFSTQVAGFKELNEEEINELIGAAITAPSGGNIQPWKWWYKHKTLWLFQDVNRGVSFLNYKNKASHISHGAASENVIIKAASMGFNVSLTKFPLGNQSCLIAGFRFTPTGSIVRDELATYIQKRYTNRTIGARILLKKEDQEALLNSILPVPGARLRLFQSPEEMEKLKRVVAGVDRLYYSSRAGNEQFTQELRWTKEEVEATRDGIDIETLDVTPTERAGLMVSRTENVARYLREWGLGSAFGKISKKAIDASSALCLITMPKAQVDAYFEGGRALQRVWLTCTGKGISLQPLSISLFLYARINGGDLQGIEDMQEELQYWRNEFRNICGLQPDEAKLFFFRLSYADNAKVRSLRRNIKDMRLYE